MTAVQQHVRKTIRRHGLCPAGSRVVVGLSGGSDSVALALLLLELSEHGGFEVAGLAHLNHRLRAEASRDEEFCRDLARKLGHRIVVEAVDVQSSAEADSLSIEDAARRIRYAFLERAREVLAADRIAVGHTEDDQAETFLMKLMRGAGLTGLAGIYPQRGLVIRPLLEVSRLELRGYLGSRGQDWVEDDTNRDLGNPRNRIRHRVIPELDLALGGATRPVIARAAAVIREDAQWLDALAGNRFGTLVSQGRDRLELAALAVLELPAPVRRRVLLKSLRWASGDREVGQDHVETAMAVLAGTSGGADVPGGRVELLRGKLVLLKQKAGAK